MAYKTNEENLRILVDTLVREVNDMKSKLALIPSQGHRVVAHAIAQQCITVQKLTETVIIKHDSLVFCFGCCSDGAAGRAVYWVQTPQTSSIEAWIMENLIVDGKTTKGGKEPMYRCQLMDRKTWLCHFSDTFGCGSPHLVKELASINQLRASRADRFDKWKHSFHPQYFDADPAWREKWPLTATTSSSSSSTTATTTQFATKTKPKLSSN